MPAVLRHDVVSLRADDLCRSRRTLFAGQLTVLQHAQHYSTLHTLESLHTVCVHSACIISSTQCVHDMNMKVLRNTARCATLFKCVRGWAELMAKPTFLFFDERLWPKAHCCGTRALRDGLPSSPRSFPTLYATTPRTRSASAMPSGSCGAPAGCWCSDALRQTVRM